ncbi:24037_t:CDS:2 [Entrophospora sp. SA101]|nr:10169_t:CDS:2 [Entrophospora sp. SA101]CAJ0769068.1 24037_t:CDS:2 [Entrophospora sp. SA101]
MTPNITNNSSGNNGIVLVNGNGVLNKINGAESKKEHLKLAQGFGTKAIHVGQDSDPHSGAVIPPISLSTTFKQESIGNPSRNAFEQTIASLEKGKYALAFSSGSATTATIITTIGTGGHIIAVNELYGGTYRYFKRVADSQSIATSFVELNGDVSEIEKGFRDDTRIVWIETPSNPTLRLADISAIAKITHKHNAILVVDNTFLSPYFQNPLDLGADIVVHSVTKYINGHSDVVMGVAITNSHELYEKIKFLQNAMGAIPSPFDCWLASRGVKTLHLRMKQHEKNALALAKYLESVPDKVEKVIYPGLESHPQYELAKNQQKGFGGMISFKIKGGFDEANTFLQSTNLFTLAESLVRVESLAEHPARMTHASVAKEHREALGITDNLIRLSVGIEETKDLANIKQALNIAVP